MIATDNQQEGKTVKKFIGATAAVLLCVATAAADSLTGTATAVGSPFAENYISCSGSYSIPQNATDIQWSLGCLDDDLNWIYGQASGSNGSWSGTIWIGMADSGTYTNITVTITYMLNGKEAPPVIKMLGSVTF
jgi:hypothetical protein